MGKHSGKTTTLFSSGKSECGVEFGEKEDKNRRMVPFFLLCTGPLSFYSAPAMIAPSD